MNAKLPLLLPLWTLVLPVAVVSAQSPAGWTAAGAFPELSGNGRVLVYRCHQTRLEPGPVPAGEGGLCALDLDSGVRDVMVVEPVGEVPPGTRSKAVSEDGRYVAFLKDGNNGDPQLYLFDRVTRTTELISVGPDGVSEAEFGVERGPIRMTPGARFISFHSFSTNLVAGTSNEGHIFVRDRQLGTTEIVSRSSGGTEVDFAEAEHDISDDGNFVVFVADDVLTAGDTNSDGDVFLRDRAAGTTTRISQAAGEDGGGNDPRISGDGLTIGFHARAWDLGAVDQLLSNVTEIFLTDVGSDLFRRGSPSPSITNGDSNISVNLRFFLSAGGRFVVFLSTADDHTADDETDRFQNPAADVYWRDDLNGTTTLVNRDDDGTQWSKSASSSGYSMSDDGRYVAWQIQDPVTSGQVIFVEDMGDVLGPQLSNVFLPSTAPLGDVVMFEARASDVNRGDQNVVSVEFRIDDGVWQPMEPEDGAFDSPTEDATANIDTNTVGTGHHQVCVRAFDSLGNVDRPVCKPILIAEENCTNGIDDDGNGLIDREDPSCPIGMQLICLHDPFYPASLGESVTITAEVTDEEGNPAVSQSVEIYRNGILKASGADAGTLDLPFVGNQSFSYRCRALRGSEVFDSGTVAVAAGPPTTPFRAIPVRQNADRDLRHAIDVVFLPDDNDFTGFSDPAFISQVGALVRDGYYTIPWFVQHQAVFNFWVGRDAGNSSPDFGRLDNNGNPLCFRQAPDNFDKEYKFADVAGILHTAFCRDNAGGSPSLFTIGNNPARRQVVAHETGHRPFGLADEYCCDGGYFRKSTLPNLYKSESGCRNGAADRGFDPDQCRAIVDVDTDKDWWIFEPNFNLPQAQNFNEIGDLMQQTGNVFDPADPNGDGSGLPGVDRYRVGDSEIQRMLWFLQKCLEGKC